MKYLLMLITFCSISIGKSQGLVKYSDTCIAAHFPGGLKEQINFFNENLVQFDFICDLNATIYIEITIDTAGKILNPCIKRVRGRHEFMNEALRLVKLMPNWVPMVCNGKPQACKIVLPVRFVPQ